jgi:hypothetical protein
MHCKKWNTGPLREPKAKVLVEDTVRQETQTNVSNVWSMDILPEIAKSPLPKTSEEVILVLLEMICCQNSTTSASVWKIWRKDRKTNINSNPKVLIDQPVEVDQNTPRRIRTPVLTILQGTVPRALIMEAPGTIPRLVQKTSLFEQPRISK